MTVRLENPLLPNAKLRELYGLMQRARALSKASSAAPRLEAILCSTLMHVEPGDFVSAPSAATAALVAERITVATRKKSAPAAPAVELPAHQRLAAVAGIAQGLKLAGANRLAVYFGDAGTASARTEQGWAEALTYASRAALPLLFVCADATGTQSARNANAITWQSMSKVAKPLKLPVLTVDGTDAAALYRVMQESTLRARTIGGAAVLWCLLPKTNTPATDPLRHMKRYLEVRNLLPGNTK